MRNLFFHVFRWFWLTVVIVGVAIGVSVTYSARVLDACQSTMISTILSTEAPRLAEIMERSGKSDARKFVASLVTRYPVKAFFFDSNEPMAVDGKLPPEIQKMAILATREEGLHVRGSMASQSVKG